MLYDQESPQGPKKRTQDNSVGTDLTRDSSAKSK